MKIKIIFISGREETLENVPYKNIEDFLRKEFGVGSKYHNWYIGNNKGFQIKNIESIEMIGEDYKNNCQKQ